MIRGAPAAAEPGHSLTAQAPSSSLPSEQAVGVLVKQRQLVTGRANRPIMFFPWKGRILLQATEGKTGETEQRCCSAPRRRPRGRRAAVTDPLHTPCTCPVTRGLHSQRDNEARHSGTSRCPSAQMGDLWARGCLCGGSARPRGSQRKIRGVLVGDVANPLDLLPTSCL